MRINKKYLEVMAIAVLYLAALFVWTLPIHNNKYPFGDVDASSHFGNGDYMYTHDKSILEMPDYFKNRYYAQNEAFPWALWYPPQFWTDTGIMQVLGGDRLLPFFIFITISCTLFILSTYFLVRQLFGFWPAFLSGLLLIFSVRDYMILLFGQWPQSVGFAFTPIVLYCYYMYTKSYSEGREEKNIYIYIMALLLVAQNMMHPQGFIASVGTIMIYSFMLIIKEKKFPVKIKHIIIVSLIFLGVSTLLTPLNMGEFFGEIVKTGATEKQAWDLGILLSWYPDSSKYLGLPDFYFHYKTSHGDGTNLSYWTLPLLFIGIGVILLNGLFIKSEKRSMLLLAWLIAFYLLTHLSAFGMGSRDQRMMAYEAHVFYPIIAIGLLSIPSLIRSFKINKRVTSAVKYLLIIVFIFLALSINGKSAYNLLESQQNSIMRINPYQYQAAEWLMNHKIPEGKFVYTIGTAGYNYFGGKVKWLSVLSQTPFIVDGRRMNDTDYVMIDYSDFVLLGRQDLINNLRSYELANFANVTPLYNSQYIKVYKVDEDIN